MDYGVIKEKIEKEVLKQFKPEFLNRLDGMVIFHPLTRDDLIHVIEIEVTKLQKRIAQKEVSITLDDNAKAFLIDKGFEPERGARPLRRKIEEFLADPLTDEILRHPGESRSYLVTTNQDELVFINQEATPLKANKKEKGAKPKPS